MSRELPLLRHCYSVTSVHELSDAETYLRVLVKVCQNQTDNWVKKTPCGSPFWKVKRRSACQKIPRLLCKIHCGVHKDLPLHPNQGYMDPFHSPLCFHNLRFFFRHLPLYTKSPNSLIALRFQSKILYNILISPLRPTCPTYLIRLDLIILT
jgi:hypothetical protein